MKAHLDVNVVDINERIQKLNRRAVRYDTYSWAGSEGIKYKHRGLDVVPCGPKPTMLVFQSLPLIKSVN